MQQQQPPPKNQNNMITEIDKIPLKTNEISTTDDMNDPLVKDVLTEFENELLLSNKPPTNNYNINNSDDDDTNIHKNNSQYQKNNLPELQSQQTAQQSNRNMKNSSKNEKIKYYDELLLNKSFIICIIIAIIINPYIFTTIINNLPENISSIIDSYNYFIKLGLIFGIIYLLMVYKVL
jgi:hypothetical protein